MPRGDNPTTKKEGKKKRKILVMQLSSQQLTIEQIANLLQVSARQAYKWVRMLEEDGHDVIMRRNPNDKQIYYSILV